VLKSLFNLNQKQSISCQALIFLLRVRVEVLQSVTIMTPGFGDRKFPPFDDRSSVRHSSQTCLHSEGWFLEYDFECCIGDFQLPEVFSRGLNDAVDLDFKYSEHFWSEWMRCNCWSSCEKWKAMRLMVIRKDHWNPESRFIFTVNSWIVGFERQNQTIFDIHRIKIPGWIQLTQNIFTILILNLESKSNLRIHG
jgi:hypothetical protein